MALDMGWVGVESTVGASPARGLIKPIPGNDLNIGKVTAVSNGVISVGSGTAQGRFKVYGHMVNMALSEGLANNFPSGDAMNFGHNKVDSSGTNNTGRAAYSTGSLTPTLKTY